MLDIKFIRKNPGEVRKNLERRQDKELLKRFDQLIEKDREYRTVLSELEKLRAEHNRVNVKIAELTKMGKSIGEIGKLGAGLSKKIEEAEKKVNSLAEEVRNLLLRIPNMLHESVPFGKGEEENVVVREWGKKRKFGFVPRSHVDLLQQLDLADFERAAKISGARFYFLKGDCVKLDLALLLFTIDHLVEKGFFLIEPPFMMRRKAYEGVVDLSDFETMMYKIEGEDIYNIATAEHPLIAMHMDEIIDEKKLPIKYVGISPCFRKEAGAHGKDTKGIFRVHQFNQTEQIVICKPEQSWNFFEEMVRNAEEVFQALEIPYRVVNVCTGDIGTVAAKKYDIEAWMPAQNKYREVISCSNCTAYQSMRLNIKYGKVGGTKDYIHTLNATGVATGRAIVAILENYQQEDGSITVPKVLQSYLGKELIIKQK